MTGTLTGGKFTKGEHVVVQPDGLKTTIRNLQSHSASVDEANPGMRTAINLSDVVVGKNERKGIQRGDVVTRSNFGKETHVLDVWVQRSSREVVGQPATSKPIKMGQRVRWHHGGASHSARIYWLDERSLKPGEEGFAQLRFDQPVYAFYGDHFVIRDWPKTSSLAGGVILDFEADGKRFRTKTQRTFLNARAEAPDDLKVAVTTLLARDHFVATSGLLSQSHFSSDAISREIAQMQESDLLEQAGPWLVDRTWWASMAEKLSQCVQAYHQEHTDQLGMPLSEVRPQFSQQMPQAGLLDALFDSLTGTAVDRVGNALRHQSHRPTLPPEMRVTGDHIRRQLIEKPLEPPNPKELAPTADAQKVLRFLIEMGEVMDLSEKCVLLTETFNGMQSTVVTHLRAHERATVSDLRQLIGTTRRVLMPVLDKLDKTGVTVRHEDVRMLSRSYLRAHPE